eukprot:2008669-Amphidinium_carterae.1
MKSYVALYQDQDDRCTPLGQRLPKTISRTIKDFVRTSIPVLFGQLLLSCLPRRAKMTGWANPGAN